jgi:hypothetical protein
LGCISGKQKSRFGQNFANLEEAKKVQVSHLQGDQIGRIFALWAVVFFEQFLKNSRSSQYFCVLF